MVSRICDDHRPAGDRRIMARVGAQATPARVLASDRSPAAKAERPHRSDLAATPPLADAKATKLAQFQLALRRVSRAAAGYGPPKGSALHRTGRARRVRPADSTSLV